MIDNRVSNRCEGEMKEKKQKVAETLYYVKDGGRVMMGWLSFESFGDFSERAQ
jgi:hypothetical protein